MPDTRDQLISGIASIAAMQRQNNMLENELAVLISGVLSIDEVRIIDTYGTDRIEGALHGYILNTKKNVIDNQLSDYSAFPELVSYKELGYRSCCFMPVIADGKVVAILRMLSKTEEKFSDSFMETLTPGLRLLGYVLAYKHESAKSEKLAGYFNAAFETPEPQFIVSSSSTIIKSNRAAKRSFEAGQLKNIGDTFTIDASQVRVLTDGNATKVLVPNQRSARAIYSLSANKISDSLVDVHASDVTDAETLHAVISAMGSSGMGVLLLSSSLSISYATPSVAVALKYDQKMLDGENIAKFLTMESFAKIQHEISKPGTKPAQSTGCLDLFTADSSMMHVHYSIGKAGTDYVLVFAKAEDEAYLASINTVVSEFINGSSEIVIRIDKLGNIVDCNIMAQSILGYGKESLIGTPIRDIYFSPHHIERDLAFVMRGTKLEGSYVNLKKSDDTMLPATQSIYELKSQAGESNYIIAIRELDTKRRLQDYDTNSKKQKREMDALKSAGELKSQFLYNISHELKTPLTNIKGFAKLLHDGEFGALNEQQMEHLNILLEESDRLSFMIQQVLDAVKLESNRVKLELKEVNLKDLMDGPSIKALQEKAISNGLEFKCEVAFDVPKITADPNRLIQVFVNLIGNSIKFTEKGSIAIRILRKSKKMVQCEVSDTGIGISEEDKKKIFREFYQAHKEEMVKQKDSGTGLGLSITKYIIRLHHGKIWLDSEYGKGTTFIFTLPVTPPAPKKKKPQK